MLAGPDGGPEESVGAGTAGCPGWGAYGDVVLGTAVVVAGLLDGAEALVEVSGPAVLGVAASAFAAVIGLCVYTGIPDISWSRGWRESSRYIYALYRPDEDDEAKVSNCVSVFAQ